MSRELIRTADAWNKVKIARDPNRPNAKFYINEIFDEFIELHGDRNFGDDKAIIGGIALLNNLSFTVIGICKGENTKENIKRNFGMPHPEGYRKALRLMKQAEKFKRPVICFVDTPGAFCGIGAEERGQGQAIAQNLVELMGLKVPVISIVIGEGGSGGALGLGVSDRIYMLENSVYSVISPEGCAAILYKDASRAEEAAENLKITAQSLYKLGVIDGIVEEPAGGAHRDHKCIALNLKNIILSSFSELEKISVEELVENRYNKFRKMGSFIGTDI